MTKAEIKAAKRPVKLKIRRGDKVMIIAGKDKGEVGYVAAVSPKEQKLIVLKETEDPKEPLPLNAVTKHRKARSQAERSQRLKLPAPIHISNVQLLDPKTGKPTRIARKRDDNGKGIRVTKGSGTTLTDQLLPHESLS